MRRYTIRRGLLVKRLERIERKKMDKRKDAGGQPKMGSS
jgi:hypothetical protein